MKTPPLWTCPQCGAGFVSAHMSHSCGRFREADLFARTEPRVVALFDRFRRMVQACGPVVAIPQKTRLVFMVRMRFAAVYPRRTSFRVGLVLARRLPAHSRIEKVEHFGPHSIVHSISIAAAGDLDATLQRWVREAYDRGCQKHLSNRPRRPSVP